MQTPDRLVFALMLSLVLLLTGCGGGGGGDEAPPPAGTLVGPAGGTVEGPNGARLLIPAGMMYDAAWWSMAAVGATFALTPHGTTFDLPVTLTLPFDRKSVPAGSSPALLKTNAAGQWEEISSATFAADTVTAVITSFSFAVAMVPPERSSEATCSNVSGTAAEI